MIELYRGRGNSPDKLIAVSSIRSTKPLTLPETGRRNQASVPVF